MPPKHFQRCPRSVSESARCNFGWGLQIQNDRSRTSVQAGVISQPSPGQHWGLRPFRLHVPMHRDGFLLQRNRAGAAPAGESISFARVVQQQRHDVESVASAGAIPAASTIFRPASFKVKPRSFKPWNPERYRGGPPFAGSSNRRTAPFEGAYVGANPAPAANFRSVVK